MDNSQNNGPESNNDSMASKNLNTNNNNANFQSSGNSELPTEQKMPSNTSEPRPNDIYDISSIQVPTQKPDQHQPPISNEIPGNDPLNNDSNKNTEDYSKRMIGPNSINSLDSGARSSRTGTIITIILLAVIIGGIWQANKDNQGEVGSEGDSVNIVVDSSKESGSVTIVNGDEVISPGISNDITKTKIMAYYNILGKNECENVVSRERVIEKKYDSDVINTVRGLLTPLTDLEIKSGLITSIPNGTYLRSIDIVDGIAKVTFSSHLKNLAGSCRVLAVRAQIEKTLLQFSFIKKVNICIDQNCNQAEILQP